MNIGKLKSDALADHPFLAAGVDEQQILLPVVEEAEIALRIVVASRLTGVAGTDRGAIGVDGISGAWLARDHGRTRGECRDCLR